jgi:hypothetical protein
MKRILFACMATAMIATACNNETKNTDAAKDSNSTAMEKDKPADAKDQSYTMPDSATMMKNWEAYATPSDVHKMMASWDGNWTGENTMWHAPGAPPQTSKSTAVNKMLMGGRYQESVHKGDMMGMPFEGRSTLAYDNARKEFISTWVDNMGTGVMVMRGKWDDASKSMNLSGTCVDPSAGNGREMTVREVFKIVDDNHQVMEMYGPAPDGKEFKMMEIKFTRNK